MGKRLDPILKVAGASDLDRRKEVINPSVCYNSFDLYSIM
jgi:hypothetical protein